jgi:hypothetical protein
MFWRETSTYRGLLPELATLVGRLPEGLVQASAA